MENLSTDTGDLPPTAAVGSTAPAGTNNQPDPTFTMEQVMSLMASITKQAASSAASSAVNAALTACQAPARDRGNFYLPPFDPDVRSHDVRDWCANIDDTIATFGIPPQEARMKAILQLKGRAKIWADTWSLQSTSWNQMKQDLISTFSNEFRYADDVQKWRSYTSDHATSYAEYATTGWTLFKRVHPEATDTQVVDALITESGDLPWHTTMYWFLFNLTTTIALMITALYWTLLYKPDSEENNTRAFWLDVMTHGFNSCIVVIELVASRTPVRALHVYQPLGVGLWYAAFSGIYFAAGGTDGKGNPYIYEVLDWRQGNRAGAIVAGSVAGLLIIYTALWCIAFCRDKISTALVRTTSHDLELAPPDQHSPVKMV